MKYSSEMAQSTWVQPNKDIPGRYDGSLRTVEAYGGCEPKIERDGTSRLGGPWSEEICQGRPDDRRLGDEA